MSKFITSFQEMCISCGVVKVTAKLFSRVYCCRHCLLQAAEGLEKWDEAAKQLKENEPNRVIDLRTIGEEA